MYWISGAARSAWINFRNDDFQTFSVFLILNHGQHLAFNKDDNASLCRLYVSMLQWLGVETDSFGSGSGTLPGLEFA